MMMIMIVVMNDDDNNDDDCEGDNLGDSDIVDGDLSDG